MAFGSLIVIPVLQFLTRIRRVVMVGWSSGSRVRLPDPALNRSRTINGQVDGTGIASEIHADA
ncbi:MAG: hypothetical protein KDI44_14215 [Thiothrix sp.]|nr:hypothetical protein [Thiothrix sp.]HPQ94956.1 hypothetical protein [Thiolinea sp.]